MASTNAVPNIEEQSVPAIVSFPSGHVVSFKNEQQARDNASAVHQKLQSLPPVPKPSVNMTSTGQESGSKVRKSGSTSKELDIRLARVEALLNDIQRTRGTHVFIPSHVFDPVTGRAERVTS